MMFRTLLIPCVALFTSVAVAQSAPPARTPASASTAPSDHWNAVPATSSSSSYRTTTALPGDDSHGPFKFKQPDKTGPAYALPPQANDKDAVMGKKRPWQNGTPPLDCKGKPDPACH